MGTRCNVLLTYGSTKIWLYRHWDGYVSMTGADLANKLRDALTNINAPTDALYTFQRFAHSLMNQKRGGDGRDKDQPQYELTNGEHGDIEHLYAIAFSSSGARVTHTRIPFDAERVSHRMTPSQFVVYVNREIDATNKRISELNGSNGSKYPRWKHVEQFATA